MRKRKFRTHAERGFTLIELMVALTMGLLLSLGLIRVFASSSETYHAMSQAAQQIENGRYAVQAISDDLRHSGYYGEFAFALAAGTTLPDPCELTTAATIRAALSFHLQGYNDPASSPLTCLNSANLVPGTDILVIRRANTVTTAIGALVGNEIYLQANSDPNNSANPVIDFGSNAAAFTLTQKDGTTLAEIRKYRVLIYFVSPCSVPASGDVCSAAADGGRPIPTLKRLSLAVDPGTGALTMRTEAIAEGVENLQVDYGIDADGDGMPDGSFLAVPATVADWGNVTSAQINVLARSTEAVAGWTDTKTYSLGTAGTVSPGGNFRRHVFTSQVRLTNPAARREVP
jgi:type IV pilus assembly protein PilW